MSNQDFEDDGLTAGEKAYLESGGENAAGLLNENPGAADGAAATDPAPVPQAADLKPAADAAKAAGAKDHAPPVAKQPPAKQAAAAGDEDDDDAPPDGKIPYQKYQRDRKKAREQIKALEKQNSDLNEKFARGDERLRLLSEAMQPVAQQEVDHDPEPDPNTDLIAWANWSRRENGRMREAMVSTHNTVTSSRDDQIMHDNYQRDVMSFAREMPDFGGAYKHLLNSRAAMLSEQGYDQQTVERILLTEEKGLVQRAFHAGKRPAAMIYNMARQMGWAPPAPPPVPQVDPALLPVPRPAQANGGNGNGNGNGQQQPSVVEEIERIARGQAAGKSLSDGGGTPQEFSVEALATMSEHEFNALYAKSAGKIDAMLGKGAH